jgi:uncharacterized RmlC-like cupin family protein
MVKVIKPAERSCPPAVQSPGMRREAAISEAMTGAQGLWMGVGSNEPGNASGWHHHGHLESGIYVLKGNLRFRWGADPGNVVETEPGDFIFVPPYEVHREENMSATEPTEFILSRNAQEGIVVNVDDPRAPSSSE